MAIELRALRLKWLGESDTGDDQCAHGRVVLAVGDGLLVGPGDGELALSAAGLYLLRTLDADHLPGDSLTDGNQLFPCCGHFLYEEEGRCVIVGCPSGVDLSVITDGDVVALTRGNDTVVVTRSQWRGAVLGFVDQVDAFYAESIPRAPIEDEVNSAGWTLFWGEWRHRRQAAAR